MKVSVVVVTYNHTAFIDRALRSVYEQDAGFDFEVLISEDASTDGTRDIVKAWADRYPERTRLILSEQNVRSNYVVRRGFAAASGDYVALLDGDDHWTSPLKLRRQTECLDADPTLSLCFHNAEIVDEHDHHSGRLWTSADLKPRLALSDLWDGNPFATCGSMVRRSALGEIPGWYDGFFPVTDWPLYILCARKGDIAFLPEAMGAYRLHSGGLYSSRDQAAKLASMDDLYQRLNACLDGMYDKELRAGHRRYFLDWAKVHLEAGELALARASLGYAKGYGRAAQAKRLETVMLATRLAIAGRRGERGGMSSKF